MKLGLILEGGASRTYFSCGILDGLLEKNIYADYVIGTSAGISNGVSYVSKQIGRNYKIATIYASDKRYMGFKHLLNLRNKSYYNMDFIYDELPNKYLPFDYEAFKAFKGNVIATVTNIETGEVEYLEVPRDDRKFLVLRATCALPLIFPPIEVKGKKYMDGGIVAPIPLEKAIMDGCDKNIVILTRERGYRKDHEKSLELAARKYKKYPKFREALLKRTEIYNKNLEYVFRQEKQGKAFIFTPEKIEGLKRTESNSSVLAAIYKQGYECFKSRYNELYKYLSG